MVAHGVVHCDRINEDRSEIKFLDVVGVVCIGMSGSQRTGVSSDKTGAVSGMITRNRSPVDLIRKQENVSQRGGALSSMYSFATRFLGKPVAILKANLGLGLGVDIWEAVDPSLKELIQKLPHPNHQDSIKSMTAFLENGCRVWGKSDEDVYKSWCDLPDNEKTENAFHAHVVKMILISRKLCDDLFEEAPLLKILAPRQTRRQRFETEWRMVFSETLEEACSTFKHIGDVQDKDFTPSDPKDEKLKASVQKAKNLLARLEKEDNKTLSDCRYCLKSCVKEVHLDDYLDGDLERFLCSSKRVQGAYEAMQKLLAKMQDKHRHMRYELLEIMKMMPKHKMMLQSWALNKKHDTCGDDKSLRELIGEERIAEALRSVSTYIFHSPKLTDKQAELSLYELGGLLRYERDAERVKKGFCIREDDQFLQGHKLPSLMTGQDILDLVCSATVLNHIYKNAVDKDLIISAVNVFALALDLRVSTTIEERNKMRKRVCEFIVDNNLIWVESIRPTELIITARSRCPSTDTVCRELVMFLIRDETNDESDDNSDEEPSAASAD